MYVASLPPSEQAKIAANLNFDMIGSPNHVNFVYGIPAGGLFTGAEGLKTPAQAALSGGIAGELG